MHCWCPKTQDFVYFTAGYTYLMFVVCWTVHHCDNWRIKNQQDATYYFIVLLIGSTCFGHYYAHHHELATVMLITTLVVSFCKDGGSNLNVKLGFLVVCVRCEVVCRLVVAGNVFLLILTLILLMWRIWLAPINASKGQMGFNSVFKGLIVVIHYVWWS